MFVINYIALAVTIYVGTFSKDFDSEDVGKALLFLIVCTIISVTVSILSHI